jgi:PhnB protein
MAAKKAKARGKSKAPAKARSAAAARAKSAKARKAAPPRPSRRKGVPEGFGTVTPHLVVEGAADALDFYKRAFGAEELVRMPMPDGQRLMHAAIKIGESMLMLVDAFEEWGVKGPKSLGGSPVTIHLFVPDVDAAFQRAVDAGCTVAMPVADQFWGDRYGKLKDPFGHDWSLATHLRQLSPAEMHAAMKQAFGRQEAT